MGFKSSIGFINSKNVQVHITKKIGQFFINLYLYLFVYMPRYTCVWMLRCYFFFPLFFLHTSIKGFSICYKWILFLIFHFGCDLFITLQKMDCLYVHSFDGQRCAFSLCHWNGVDDNFSICENNFFINGCYISTSGWHGVIDSK